MWGNPLPSYLPAATTPTCYKILVGGQPFTVRSNLYDFLRRYASKRYYWIDAIYINQNDILERNTQVGIMVKIYSHIEGTFAWLREQDAASNKAFDMIANFTNAKRKLRKDYDKKVLH